MHTNGIITDMTGGLLGRSGATPQLPRPPLAGLWLTCSSYLGIRDNRLHFVENAECTWCYFCHDTILSLCFAAVCDILSDNHKGISSERLH